MFGLGLGVLTRVIMHGVWTRVYTYCCCNPWWIRVRCRVTLLVCGCVCLQMVLPEREFYCDFYANVCLAV